MSGRNAKLIRKTLNEKVQLEMYEYLALLMARPFRQRLWFCLKLMAQPIWRKVRGK